MTTRRGRRALRLRVALFTIAAASSAFGVDAAAQPACTAPKTSCIGADGYYASAEDLGRVTAVSDPVLKELRACLDGAGGKHITPQFVVRWDSEGNAVNVKVDAPGYDTLPCVTKIADKLKTLQNPHETAIRCEYSCNTLKPTTPTKTTPPPVVVAPPPTTGTPPPTTTPPPPVTTPAPAPTPSVHYEKTWYGYQTLVADVVSLTFMGAGLAAQSGGVFVIGYGTLLLGAPIIHFVHGNIGPGFGSIGLRFLIPWVGFGVGALMGLIAGGTRGDGSFEKVGNGATGAVYGAIAGFVVGVVGCAAIDAAGFAYTKEKVDGPPPSNASSRRYLLGSGLKLTPSMDVRRDAGNNEYPSIGVAGQF